MVRKIISVWLCFLMAFSSVAMLGATQNIEFRANAEISADAEVARGTLGGLWNPAGPKESATTHIISPKTVLQSHPAPLPSRVDNSAGLPPVGNQQSQGSCTAWAIGYYHATYIENRQNPIDLTNPENQTSPAFLYNVANGGINGGSYMEDVADLLISNGACSMAEQPYDTNDYTSWPSEDWIWVSGMKRKAISQNWLNLAQPSGMDAIKAHLDAGNTATTGISVWRNFDYIEDFNNTYSSSERYGTDRGGHIVTICGYDDDKPTADGMGAFRMVNSWGTGWGEAGYWWMTYEAIVDGYLGYGWTMYLESETNYSPKMVAKIQINHGERGDIIRNNGLALTAVEDGISIGNVHFLGCNWIENWYGADVQQQPFPAGNMAFDISLFLPYMNASKEHQFTLSMSNSGDLGGQLLGMEIHNIEWWEGDISWDTPLLLPSYTNTLTTAWVWPGQFLHNPLRVNSDIDMVHRAIGEFWRGDGTELNPYIIPEYFIWGETFGHCIFIGNTTCHFAVRNCDLEAASGIASWPYYPDIALILYNVTNGKVENSTIHSNAGWSGIFILQSQGIILDGNTVYDNDGGSGLGCGVYMESSGHCVIASNNLSDDGYGMYFFGGTENVILRNRFEGALDVALYLDSWDPVNYPTQNNKIYANDFINNNINAYDNDPTNSNSWDNGYPSGGNYWSEYTGVDRLSGPNQTQLCSDGIGDTPYLGIDGKIGAHDNYPLTEPCGSFPHEPKFFIDLVPGWNFISMPMKKNDTAVSNALSSIAGLWDAVKYFDSADKLDPWKSNRAGAFVNDLLDIKDGMGFWVHTTGNCTLAVSGSVPVSSSMVLYAGWNMVGYPSLAIGVNVGDAFWGTGADRVEAFNSGSPNLIKEVGPDYLMNSGEGYWVHVPYDTVWTVNP
jgi:parallel beta-helix repeat protein